MVEASNQNFGQVLESLKKGQMAQRASWDCNTFVFMQVPSQISIDLVPKMTSLPQHVKDEFIKRSDDEWLQVVNLYYTDQLALVNQSNLITGYSPSVSDVMAEDWVIF